MEVCHYGQANVDHIRKAVDLLPWEKASRNLNINIMISFIEQYGSEYIISNYIPHEKVTFDDRDPPSIDKNAGQLILEKNEVYEKYVKENKDPKLFEKIR